MGFDKNTNLIIPETRGMIISRFIKNNTPQIALLIPLVIALVSCVSNFFIYIYKRGYYDYFNLDNSFIVFNRTTIINELITTSIASLIYWVYSIFSVRMFYKRENILMKLVCFFIIPFSLNFIFVFYSLKLVFFNDITNLVAVIILCVLFIFLHWPLISLMGHFMAGTLNNDVLEQYKKEKLQKKNVNIQNKENNKKATNKKNIKSKQRNEGFFATLIFLGAILAYILGTRYCGYANAKNEKQFVTVKIENLNYAVIATDGNQFILELCDVSKDKKSVVIDTNTYMKVDCKNLIIHRYEFESVSVK